MATGALTTQQPNECEDDDRDGARGYGQANAKNRDKFVIRRLKLSEAKELAAFALECESAGEILARCQELARQIAPSLFENK